MPGRQPNTLAAAADSACVIARCAGLVVVVVVFATFDRVSMQYSCNATRAQWLILRPSSLSSNIYFVQKLYTLRSGFIDRFNGARALQPFGRHHYHH